MSGRLIITTKKSYCPWSSSNVEKVLHDERLERERSDRTREEEAAAASEWRIDELKRRRGIAGGVVRPIDVVEHTQIFVSPQYTIGVYVSQCVV